MKTLLHAGHQSDMMRRMSLTTPEAIDNTPPSSSVLSMTIAPLTWQDPLTWLALGFKDLRRSPGAGLFYGGCFWLMGQLLFWVFHHSPANVLALSAGFLLMGPFLCLGLYDISRRWQLHDQEGTPPPDLGESMLAWTTALGPLSLFAGLLLILEMLWGRCAMVVFAVNFSTMPSQANLLALLSNPDHLEFILTYLGVGGVFAALIYGISVVSIPMILDKRCDAISASLVSLKACLSQPAVMLWWGFLISLLVVLSMLPYFLGLLVVGPLIGHATWHAYQGVTGLKTP
jgi:uncharacterized membrane protein